MRLANSDARSPVPAAVRYSTRRQRPGSPADTGPSAAAFSSRANSPGSNARRSFRTSVAALTFFSRASGSADTRPVSTAHFVNAFAAVAWWLLVAFPSPAFRRSARYFPTRSASMSASSRKPHPVSSTARHLARVSATCFGERSRPSNSDRNDSRWSVSGVLAWPAQGSDSPARSRSAPISNSRSISRAAALSAASGTHFTSPVASRKVPYHLRLFTFDRTAPRVPAGQRLPAFGWPGG